MDTFVQDYTNNQIHKGPKGNPMLEGYRDPASMHRDNARQGNNNFHSGMYSMHGNTMSTNVSASEESNVNYYQEYSRLYVANFYLTMQIKDLLTEKNDLLLKLAGLDNKRGDSSPSKSEQRAEKSKRQRRSANEIERKFRCPVETCGKSYGSEGSLHQHLKLKHPDHQSASVPPDKKA
eukprot:TRINITY_DN4084_c0_g1_i3.p1 TRINITY_DN4084_c0_g1~~TRINITY_DN4084_c0_g1_i3.p1  ORF type:complete len:178 (-),score=19.01 TRINITY_DN4084_c0_g1_i3:130-663(-)